MIVSTTDNWGKNAEDALNQTKPVTRLGIHDLEQSPIDWASSTPASPASSTHRAKEDSAHHQKTALERRDRGLAEADRGKLIMACGTGKTFTALKIAETLDRAPAGKRHVLFLVPSLSLLSQTLREWTAEADVPLHSLAVCSDSNIGKRGRRTTTTSADITIHDLAFPATTNAKQLVAQYNALTKLGEEATAAAHDRRLLHLPVDRRRRQGAESRPAARST